MKLIKSILLLILLSTSIINYAQPNIKTKHDKINEFIIYDSLSQDINIKNVKSYIGQTIYVIPKSTASSWSKIYKLYDNGDRITHSKMDIIGYDCFRTSTNIRFFTHSENIYHPIPLFYNRDSINIVRKLYLESVKAQRYKKTLSISDSINIINSFAYDYMSDYKSLAGKKFIIIDIIDKTLSKSEDPINGFDDVYKNIYFKLYNLSDKDTIYYSTKINNQNIKTCNDDNILIMGYFEKMKKICISNIYTNKVDMKLNDFTTGIEINLKKDSKFECIDIILVETKSNSNLILSVLLKSDNTQISIPLSKFDNQFQKID